MTDSDEPARLFLVAPQAADPERFGLLLAEALAAGDIAAVLMSGVSEEATEALAARLVPLIQAAGAAALIGEHTRIAGRCKADGVHVGGGLGDLRVAAEALKPKGIVGAGNIRSRHTAMEAGELGADYVFFGRPHGDTHDEAHPRMLDLAQWWSELMEIPAVAMAGRGFDSVAEAAETGAAFVAVHDLVWSHPGGPGEAIAKASMLLTPRERRAA